MKLTLLICLLLPFCATGNSTDDLVQRHLKNGLKMLEKGRSKDALKEFKVAQALAPERADVIEALARVESGEISTQPLSTPVPVAVSDAEAKLRVQASLSEARQAYRESELSRASAAWSRVLLLDRGNLEAKIGMARVAEEAYLKDADAPFDSSVHDLYESALREARKDRLVEARKKLDEAQSLNPSQAQVKSLLSKIENGAFAQAGLRQAEQAVKEGDRALLAGEWAAARRAYDEALGLKSGDIDALAGLKRLKEKSQVAIQELLANASKASDDGSAQSYYKRALEIDPENAEIRAAFQDAQGRRRKRESAASKKSRANALYNQGVEAWQAGQLAVAAERFKQVLEIKPRDKEAKKALATVISKLSVQVDKDKSAAAELMQQGKDFESKGKIKDALAAYERAAAKDASLNEADAAAARLKKESKDN